MAFSEDVTHITLDGYATAYIKTTSGGSYENVGLIAECKANAEPITREISKGNPTIGFNLKHTYKLAQTTPDDWTAIAGARSIYSSQIVGNTNTSTITAGASTNLFPKIGMEIDFKNSADSFIDFEVVKPGVKFAASDVAAFLTTSS